MKYTKWFFLPCLVLVVLVGICSEVSIVHAASGVSISEIMYDPSGTDANREWVEVYNGTSSEIDLAGYFILTDGLSSTHHALTAQGLSIVPVGGYAVIVQDPTGFKGDYPSYSGVMFDSSWTGLTTTSGKTIGIIDPLSAVLDQVTYDPSIGGNNTGDSLQKNDSGVWVAGVPTPGAQYVPSNTNTPDTAVPATPGTTTPALLPGPTTPPVVLKPRIQLSIPTRAVAGVAVDIQSTVFGSSGWSTNFGTTHFALGDGSAHDGGALEKFSYAYPYPGTYVVTLEYRIGPYEKDPEMVARATIDVVAPSIMISQVTSDGSIELFNPTDSETDISHWLLVPGGEYPLEKVFHIPAGTILLPGKKIMIGTAITGLLPVDAAHASLLLPSGTVASTAVAPLATVVSLPDVHVVSDVVMSHPSPVVAKSIPSMPVLAASVIEATSASPSPIENHSVIPFIIGLVIVLLLAVLALVKLGLFAQKNPIPTDEVIPENPIVESETADTIRILEE